MTSRIGNKKASSKGNKKEEEAKSAATNWNYSKSSRNDLLNLVDEGLLQHQNIVNGVLLSINSFLKKMLMKLFFFCILSKGDWPSLLPIFFMAFFVSVESRSIISIQTP
jgi:hypothetical protein